jgi:hypothetical protein
MKKSMLVLGLVFGTTLTSFAQKVPSKVEEEFKVKFPNATGIEWGKEGKNEWEAEFKIKDVKYSSNFLVDGTWKVTESEIPSSSLPKEVTATISKDFPGFKAKKVEKIESAEMNGFEIQLVNGKSKKEIVIDASGKIIKQKKK